MPAIAKVTKEMIVDAAFEIAKEMGAENITARTVSQKLGCSTQPVLYHFKTIEDVRIAAHKKASEFHIDYVTNLSGKYERPMLEVGMRYIQFAVEEKNLSTCAVRFYSHTTKLGTQIQWICSFLGHYKRNLSLSEPDILIVILIDHFDSSKGTASML